MKNTNYEAPHYGFYSILMFILFSPTYKYIHISIYTNNCTNIYKIIITHTCFSDKSHTEPTHPIYIYSVKNKILKVNGGTHEDETVCIIHSIFIFILSITVNITLIWKTKTWIPYMFHNADPKTLKYTKTLNYFSQYNSFKKNNQTKFSVL
jgi:hypothetical protein